MIGYNNLDEINIDNDRLWHNFKTFLFSMPDMISLIIGHKDDNSVIIKKNIKYQN